MLTGIIVLVIAAVVGIAGSLVSGVAGYVVLRLAPRERVAGRA